MTRFYIRVAQLVFYKAGYKKNDAYQMARDLVTMMMDNLDKYQARYQVEDEFDLAYHMAREQVTQMQQPAFVG